MEGLWLATAGDDVKLWDCSQGFALLHTFNPHCNRNIASLAWNSDGSLLASSALESEQVTLTFTKTGPLTTIQLPCGAGVQCIDFSSSSRTLVCGGVEGVSIWDLKTKTLKKSFKDHKGPVTSVHYNWNNSYVASGSETGEVILHNTLTGQSSSPLVAPSVQAVRQLEYSALKRSVLGVAGDDGAVSLWDGSTRRLLHSFSSAHLGPATGLAFSPINEMLMMSVGLDKRFLCYDIQRKHILKVFDAESPLTCIDILPDGATAAVGSTRGKVYIYDLRQGGSTPIHIFQAHKTSVHSVKFMPLANSKKEESPGGGKNTASSTSGSRRQLPSAPTVMQDITPSKTGQTPDTQPAPQCVSPTARTEIFSPTMAQGNESQHHSKSASHINLTASQGEDSLAAGVFSPLTRGAGDLSAVSQSGYRDISLLSIPSFLGQNSSAADQTSQHHNTSTAAKSSAKGQQSLLQHSLTNQHATHHQQQQQQQRSANSTADDDVLWHNVTAGHLSPLQQSGVVLSPVVGRLSHPQMCSSSLQGSLVEGHGPSLSSGTRQNVSSAVQSSSALAAVSAVNQQGAGSVCNAHDRSEASASPDSAAISGGEEGEGGGGLSPGRRTSVPFPRRSASRGRAASGRAAGPVDMGAGGAGGAGVAQQEFLRSLVGDAMEEMQDSIHRDLQALHLSMLRQFHVSERERQATNSFYAQEMQKLLLYIKELEEEIRQLKKTH